MPKATQKTEHKATAQHTFEEALGRMERLRWYYQRFIRRVSHVRPLGPGARIVDIGAAQGLIVVLLAEQGFSALGVEPELEAIRVGHRLASLRKTTITMVPGVAEAVPLASNTFDSVIAHAVIEHVLNAQAAFREAFRLLKPGGVFAFVAASSMCPFQDEIRGFPLFGWYPDALKLRIMAWAKVHRPHLIGHTRMPAINWFTPWKAGRMLRKAGFSRVYDRWDAMAHDEAHSARRAAMRIVRSHVLMKRMADVLAKGCCYLAVK